MNHTNSKQKILMVIVGGVVAATFCFFFPKEEATCGEVADGSICSVHRCAGIFQIGSSAPPKATCIGFDLGDGDTYYKYR